MDIWKHNELNVYFYPQLNGDGTNQAESFIRFIKRFFPSKKKVNSLFEWCSGPGFIGFSLLNERICDTLCLADINPLAVECIKKTSRENNLEDLVSYYVSDNMRNIPKTEKFDMVVANPPNYFALNPENIVGKELFNDLRPNDRGWEIHKEFYCTISDYLNKGAYLLIGEVEPYKKLVFNSTSKSIPYDIRPTFPIDDFRRMIQKGGLEYVGAKHFHSIFDTSDYKGVSRVVNKLYLIISKKL